ncbi:FtsK/SpoIIIE domain-containing protein [Aurantimonas litoralis]|nr:FtsK/SpoIIIE domain-containing protein [Aurantimonas litoralis]
MTPSELIGAVVVEFLKNALGQDGSDGTGRFALNLTPDQSVAAARAVLADPYLAANIDLRLPVGTFGDFGLPDFVLTDQPATFFRNAECSKAAFLLAEVGYDEMASFNEIARVGSAELQEDLALWVRTASSGLIISDEALLWWEKCLTGLRDLRFRSLDRFAAYVLRTREIVSTEAVGIMPALGQALPVLRLPRDLNAFDAVKENKRGQASAWRRQFQTLRKREGYLLKQNAQQLLLSEEDLLSAYERVKEDFLDADRPVVEAFIVAPSGWNQEAAALAECEWEFVKPLFEGLAREKFNLGEATLAFYDDGDPDLLDSEEPAYLRSLALRKLSEPSEAEVTFYEKHRQELRHDRKLKSAWDKLVHGRPIENSDFLAGFAEGLKALLDRSTASGPAKIRVRCDRATKRELKDLNLDAGLFFAHRYAGFRTLFGPLVEWDVGKLFEYSTLVEEWKGDTKRNRSTAKAAYQLKFLLELERGKTPSATETCSVQVVWVFNPKAVTSQLVDDWERVSKHPFLECRSVRELSLAKTKGKTIDLSDVSTFTPAYDRDRGSFAPAYKKNLDLAEAWRSNLRTCQAEDYLTEADAERLERAFNHFESSYAGVLRGFASRGAGDETILEQLAAYEDLLKTIVGVARGDKNRALLLKPVLQIGVAPVDGGAPAAVCLPWHPLKLGAMWRKTRIVVNLVDKLLAAKEVLIGDTRLFFKDLAHDLGHPLYPEVLAAWFDVTPQLLVVDDVVQDYSLHEAPVASNDNNEVTNDNPTEGSACVEDLVQRYLNLNPHERANTSVVLFNCDSARLPQAVIERVGKMQSDDEDFRCQVLLRHVDGERLRDVYTSILDADMGADAYNPSEATRDFMARLRISVIADQTPTPDPKDGCPYDIVFSQDVISRHARLEWFAVNADPADFSTLLPSRWSRRRPAAADDLKSAVYLCCPVQSPVGWAYLSAVASVFLGDADRDDTRRMLPARQLSFTDQQTAEIFSETHNLGNWVVNFDELLDRRQLINQKVRVIRYKKTATQGRNLIISSSAPLGLLKSMILQRLSGLGLGLTGAELAELADRLIGDANDVSGDIVLRAAKSGRSASELIGVVLSRSLVRDRLGRSGLAGWYFLDDYAAWMGQREEQLADLLAINPHIGENGEMRISIVVSEAKYVEIESLAAKKKESEKQLRDTLGRFNEALFAEPARLDRESWLSRLADLMLDGIRVPASHDFDMAQWRRAMREGLCEIEVEGYSHVFVPTALDNSDVTDAYQIGGAPNAFQEIYGRSALRRLLLDYREGKDSRGFVDTLGFDHLHRSPTWKRTTVVMPTLAMSNGTGESEGDPAEDSADKETDCVPAHASLSEDSPAMRFKPAAMTEKPSFDSDFTIIEESEADLEWLSNTSLMARSALQQFHLQAKVIDRRLTPNSALIKFQGSANLTVDQIAKKRSELLTTHSLNVLSIRPEPGAITIAIERKERKNINVDRLWEVWKPQPRDTANHELLIGIHEKDGSPLFLSPGFRHAPHTLIAGSTGSGKSVLMRNILLAIGATNTPEQAQIVLIDPKGGVDYFAFEGLPHLQGGIIDDQERSIERLTELVKTMDERYALFKENRVSDLPSYNAKVAVKDRLPVIWVVHDEFAEWMLTPEYKQGVGSIVSRLGVKARAAGIHLVFAAQRPDANVMIPQLRANLGNRLILKVDSEGTSEISLGEKGAERLLGRGHLLAKLDGEYDVCFAQVPLISSDYVEEYVRYIAERSGQFPDRMLA